MVKKNNEPKIYGYCRISTATQNIERQERNIKEYNNAAILTSETFTGTTSDRIKWNYLISKRVKSGDVIIFDSVSRMSRNAKQGLKDYKKLMDKGVQLEFLKEPHINTEIFKQAMNQQISTDKLDDVTTPIIEGINKALLVIAEKQIELAFIQAEKEVSDLQQRTKEGIETARINGKVIGRPVGAKIVTSKSLKAKKQILKHYIAFGGELNMRELAELLSISPTSVNKYIKELKQEQKQEQPTIKGL